MLPQKRQYNKVHTIHLITDDRAKEAENPNPSTIPNHFVLSVCFVFFSVNFAAMLLFFIIVYYNIQSQFVWMTPFNDNRGPILNQRQTNDQ